MDKLQKPELEVRWASVRLVERFMNVLYPFDIRMLLRLLPNIGYVVPQKRLKGVMEAGEAVAIKGNLELILDSANKALGIEGNGIPEVIDGFKELRSFWMNQLNPSPTAVTHYVELGGEGVVKSKNNPVEAFSNFWSKSEIIQGITDIVGIDVVNFGFRLVCRDKNPNNTDWFDLRIQPDVLSSGNQYYTNIVWRSGDLETLLNSIATVNDKILALIRKIEGK